MLLPVQSPGVRRSRRARPYSGLPAIVQTADGLQPLEDYADDMEDANGEDEEYGEADV